MKLTKKETQKIADNYNLGKVKRVKYLSEGWVNWNYKVETDTGKYVIKIIGGGDMSAKYIKERFGIQKRLLDYLSNKKFPYELIKPIKDKSGRYLMNFKKRFLWTYSYLEGEQKKDVTKKELQDIAKALAIFHKDAKSFKTKEKGFERTSKWLIKDYKRLSKVKVKNKTDKLFVENREFFRDWIEKISKIDFGKMQITHRDFHENNMIFRKGEIKGIIDFDGAKNAPRVLDVALAIFNTHHKKYGWTKEKQKIFINAYEKIIPLTQKEKSFIPFLLIRHQALLFIWFYDEMEKNLDKKYSMMKQSIHEAKLMMEQLK